MRLISNGNPLYLGDKKQFRLIDRWVFQHDRMGCTFVVLSGYRSDLASVPKFIWWWQWGKWNLAAIAHDYIYEHGYILQSIGDELIKVRFNRKSADVLFLEVMLSIGVRPRTARLMYLAVRLFGGRYWLH